MTLLIGRFVHEVVAELMGQFLRDPASLAAELTRHGDDGHDYLLEPADIGVRSCIRL